MVKMNKFSIKDIETITGIKSHTIRVWEQRYNLLQTKRTDTNIRYYDDDDLRFLLNVSILNDSGIKISEIVKMSSDEIAQKVESLSEVENNYTCHIQSLVKYSLELNEEEFKKAFNQAVKKIGFEQTMIQVTYPFLKKIGIMWQTGMINPAQEHFATNLIKQKIIVAIFSVKPFEIEGVKKFLLFLPENEYHEIALLFAYYMIKLHGHKVLYLGQSLSLNYVREVIDSYHPDYIFSILTNSMNHSEINESVRSFVKSFPNQTILLAGNALKDHKLDDLANVINLQDVADLLSFLNQVDMTYANAL